MQNDGLITVEGRKITVKDRNALEEILNWYLLKQKRVIRKSLTNMKFSSSFLNEKALEIVEFQGLCWWMIRGSNTILSDFPNRSKHWKERSWRRPQGVRFSKCNSKCNHYCQRDRTKRINNDAAKGTGSMLPKLFFYWRAFVQPCNFWFNLPKWFTIKDSRF